MSALLFAFLIGLTVVRARKAGADWLTIIGTFSQYFNFLLGGDLRETFSARTGRSVRDGDAPVWLWNICCFVLDCLFIGVERNHCFASVKRKKEYEDT